MRPYLYEFLSVGLSVCPSVRWSVRPSVMLSSKLLKNGLLRILNDLDSAGRGGKRDEEGGTGEEDGATRRKNRQWEWKNEEVVKNEKWKSGSRMHRWPPCSCYSIAGNCGDCSARKVDIFCPFGCRLRRGRWPKVPTYMGNSGNALFFSPPS